MRDGSDRVSWPWCTGVGRALPAFSGMELTDAVLARPPARLTPHSGTDPARLRTAIEQVQASGLAYEEQEAALGVSCIAAPVFDGPPAAAALSVAVPRSGSTRPDWRPSCGRPRWDCRVYCVRAGTRKGVPTDSLPADAVH